MPPHLIAAPSRMDDHGGGGRNDATAQAGAGPREAQGNAAGTGLPLREPRDQLVRPARLGVLDHAAEVLHRRAEAVSEKRVIIGKAEVVKRQDAGIFERSFIDKCVIRRVAHLIERAVIAGLRGNLG